MIRFLLRKAFYDLWDNLFSVLLLNLGFIALAALPFLALSLRSNTALAVLLLCAGILLCSVYLVAVSYAFAPVSQYESFRFADIPRHLKAALPAGLVLGALVCGLALLAVVVIPFYLGMNSLPGFFLSALVFWIFVSACIALQFFAALHCRLRSGPAATLKKCFILFFDNTAFCLFVFLHSLVILPVSVFLLFLAPGPAGIILFLDEALRLRLLKYDWIQAHPDADKRHIPWDELLAPERELTGVRTLRNFIFPWK